MNDFKILTVCTGNICRSPLAEQLFKIVLQDLPVEIDSAGVGALVGEGMPDEQLQIARRLGVENPESHVAKSVTAQMLDESDLILAMDRGHRREIVEMHPKTLRKVFTIRELARIIDSLLPEDYDEISSDDQVQRLKQAVEVAVFGRGLADPPEDPDDYDVVDPYRRSSETYELSSRQLTDSLNVVAQWLRRVSA